MSIVDCDWRDVDETTGCPHESVDSALHTVALRKVSTSMMSLLLSYYQGDLDVEDRNGVTPLDILERFAPDSDLTELFVREKKRRTLDKEVFLI